MSGVSFSSYGTLKAMRVEFGRLANPPLKTIARLEQELANTFATTQAATHVITSSLKRSGKTSTDYSSATWEGTIAYGGESPGSVNDPVDYAIYEMARGGVHDFLAPAIWHEPVFEEIINDHFDKEG